MAKGKVVQVIGTVVDIEFPQGQLPAIYNGIVIPVGENKVIVEVQAHIGNNWVRGVSMTATDGLARGAEAIDMGTPISVPVGRGTLGRLFNVFGEAIDGRGEVIAEREMADSPFASSPDRAGNNASNPRDRTQSDGSDHPVYPRGKDRRLWWSRGW